MSATCAFPNVPAGQLVGPLAGRRFMESLCSTTLQGMARGLAGEPTHVAALAATILQERGVEAREAQAPATVSAKPACRTQSDNRISRWREERREPAAPLRAVTIMDGRESREGIMDFIPRNAKERFQANIARFSKLTDQELRMIAMQRTSPESKAARHLIEWRTTQAMQ